MMRSRQAWIQIFATLLGVSPAACHRTDATSEPAPDSASMTDVSIVDAKMIVDSAQSDDAAADAPDGAPEKDGAVARKAPAPASSEEITAWTLEQRANSLPNNPIGNARASCGASADPPSGGLRCTAAPPAPAVQVQLTGAGTLGTDDRVIATLRPTIRACANVGLAQDPTALTGSLTLKVDVDSSGDVGNVTSATNSGLPVSSVQCMQLRVRRAQFASSSGPRSMTITVKQTKL